MRLYLLKWETNKRWFYSGRPSSAFYKKCHLQKLNMHQRYLQRKLTSRRLKIQQHVCDTLLKVNSVLVLQTVSEWIPWRYRSTSSLMWMPFWMLYPAPPVKTEPQCPCCLVDMTYGSIQHENGSVFDYYRCPMTRFNTKCHITSSKEDLAQYLKAAD